MYVCVRAHAFVCHFHLYAQLCIGFFVAFFYIVYIQLPLRSLFPCAKPLYSISMI